MQTQTTQKSFVVSALCKPQILHGLTGSCWPVFLPASLPYLRLQPQANKRSSPRKFSKFSIFSFQRHQLAHPHTASCLHPLMMTSPSHEPEQRVVSTKGGIVNEQPLPFPVTAEAITHTHTLFCCRISKKLNWI